MTEIWQKLAAFFDGMGNKIFWAIVVFIVGFILIKIAERVTRRLLNRTKVEPILYNFILMVIKIILIILLALTCLDMLGVKTTSLITALGAVGLAVSLALQNSLANLAGGVVLLFTKPFVAGDYVSIGDTEGTVKQISLIHTILNTLDNKRVYIPNGDISGSRITNFSVEPTRLLNLVFSIGYQDDIEKAKAVILQVLEKNPLALQDPPPLVRVCAHNSSTVDLTCRVWVNNPDYWTLNFDLYEEVKIAFDEAGIHIPFTQLDLHVVHDESQKMQSPA